jgi:peptide deformylase
MQSNFHDSLALFDWTAQNLPIRFFGDPILHQPCEPVGEGEFGTPQLHEIAAALTDTLAKNRAHTGVGRGIAANQIGHPKQVIVVWLEGEPQTFINPQLAASEGLGSYWESCLSAGSFIIGEVHRPWTGTFSYQDLNGHHHELKAGEQQTRLLLHEMDHLQGTICPEKYEPRTLRFIRGGKDEILSYPFKRLS